MLFLTGAEVLTALLVAHRQHPESPAPVLIARLLNLPLDGTDIIAGWPASTWPPPLGGWQADMPLREQ